MQQLTFLADSDWVMSAQTQNFIFSGKFICKTLLSHAAKVP